MLEGLVLLVHPTWMHSLANVSFLLSCLIMSMVSENGVMARVAQKARLLIFFCLLPQQVQGSRNESQTRRQKLCHMIIYWRDWSHICVATWFKTNWCKNNFAAASSTDASHKHWIREFILRVWQRIATKVLPDWAMAIYTCSFRQWRYRRVLGHLFPQRTTTVGQKGSTDFREKSPIIYPLLHCTLAIKGLVGQQTRGQCHGSVGGF